MELRQLKIFQTMAEVRNFTRAAELLGYAQSNITTQIRLLEEEFGTRLFERLGKRVSLTPDGEKLLHHANQILKLSSETKDMMAKSHLLSGTITVAVAESLCVFRLPVLFKEYCKHYPQVRLVIRMGIPADFHRWVRNNTVDLAFFLDSKISSADLVAQTLCEEPMVIVGEPGHRLGKKGYTEVRDIGAETFIFTECGCSYRAAMQKCLAEHKVEPYATYEFGSIEAIKQFAASGLGIALLPRAAVTTELSCGKLADLNWTGPKIEMFTQLVYHKNKWISPALASLLELVKRHFPIQPDGLEEVIAKNHPGG
jgi:DNA-binding transcriptional LysR family regulator